MMKKILCLFTVVIFTLAVLAGCTQKQESMPTNVEQPEPSSSSPADTGLDAAEPETQEAGILGVLFDLYEENNDDELIAWFAENAAHHLADDEGVSNSYFVSRAVGGVDGVLSASLFMGGDPVISFTVRGFAAADAHQEVKEQLQNMSDEKLEYQTSSVDGAVLGNVVLEQDSFEANIMYDITAELTYNGNQYFIISSYCGIADTQPFHEDMGAVLGTDWPYYSVLVSQA